MTTAEVLDRAADYIEQHGWCQGEFSKNGAVCVSGAISRVLGVEFYRADNRVYDAKNAFARHLKSDDPPCVWNDEDGRTQEEVIATLREAAKVQP